MAGYPNPIRQLESKAVIENTNGCVNLGREHEMVSKRTGSEQIPYIEACRKCGWIDSVSLDWWAEDIIKKSMTSRAQRIAMAAESTPFSFHQSSDEELTLEEVLFQALGAASMCWVGGTGSLEFDSVRASQVGNALLAEVQRFMRLSGEVKNGTGDGAAGSADLHGTDSGAVSAG